MRKKRRSTIHSRTTVSISAANIRESTDTPNNVTLFFSPPLRWLSNGHRGVCVVHPGIRVIPLFSPLTKTERRERMEAEKEERSKGWREEKRRKVERRRGGEGVGFFETN